MMRKHIMMYLRAQKTCSSPAVVHYCEMRREQISVQLQYLVRHLWLFRMVRVLPYLLLIWITYQSQLVFICAVCKSANAHQPTPHEENSYIWFEYSDLKLGAVDYYRVTEVTRAALGMQIWISVRKKQNSKLHSANKTASIESSMRNDKKSSTNNLYSFFIVVSRKRWKELS